MFDMHYDLLTLLYVLKDNKSYINKVINNLNNNLLGVTANLFFMSPEEMEYELNIKGNIDVPKMFEKALEIYKSLDIKCNVIFSIEGCDYIKDTNELEYLNSLGLKAILPVWNTENKYGSGNRTKNGLTIEGKKLIQKAIDLNMAIDLSHANKETFFDIIKVIKEYNKKAICYASHSNIYNLQNNPRNLTDEQLEALKSIDGYLGIVSYPPFLTDSKDETDIIDAYIQHIKYAVNKLGIDKVMLASDNMDFYDMIDSPASCVSSPFKYEKMKNTIVEILQQHFTKEEIEKIMYKNAQEIYNKLKKEGR